MNKVTILLSTYNGEKYLEEQLNSLFLQKKVDFNILARDDGSTDNTLKILNNYKNNYLNFNYYLGKNIGPCKSFLDLICKSGDSDYYAFCDQDDVWDDDKLIIAIKMLKELDNSKPLLYHSNLRVTDKNLNFIRLSHIKYREQKNKYSALIENLATGCTVVFNRKAKEYIINKIPDYCIMHDYWLYLVCKFFGETIYDFEPHLDYRQHEKNTIGTYCKKNISYLEKIFNNLKKYKEEKYIENAKNFYKVFSNLFSSKDKEIILSFINLKQSFSSRIKLFFNRDIHTSSKINEISYRLALIANIL